VLVLLDRDGVINVDRPEGVLRWDEFSFVPRALEALALLSNAGFVVAVCTNQSAIGKGLLTAEGLHDIHHQMQAEIIAAGGRIDAIFSAPDHPDHPGPRRKPAPGMLLEALAQFGADPARTPFVGDAQRDMEAAFAAHCPRILTRTGKGAVLEAGGIPQHIAPLTVCADLYDAAELITARYC